MKVIVESSMVLHLSERRHEKITNITWIKPGVASWSGFTRADSTPALQREYMDTAAEFGWKYVVLGSEWIGWANVPRQIRSLSLYGRLQDPQVGLWLSINLSTYIPTTAGEKHNRLLKDPDFRQLELKKLADWGLVGLLVHFPLRCFH